MADSIQAKKARAVLLLCHFYPGAAGAIIDHIEAFRDFSQNEYFILSNLGDLPEWLDLSRFDALVFHYSLIACYDNYISPAGRKRIREFPGFKAAFVQDDYRWINDTVTALSYMRINALFPLTSPEIMELVYGAKALSKVRKETVLAGYVPQHLAQLEVKPYSERLRDVSYRARALPAWMGSHTRQKWQIAEKWIADAPRYNLDVDISCREEDRIYGEAWIDFIANSRATLGSESGASVCDFTGDIQKNVEAHLKKYPEADFETLRDLYFKDEDCKIMMNVISPRCFESAALRTLMILYEGDYSGILEPWRHYVPLKRDHSNMDEVVSILRSPEAAQKIIDQAYNEIAKNEKYSYAAMVRLVDRVMDEEWSSCLPPACNRFTHGEFAWLSENLPQVPLQTGTSIDHVARWFPMSKVPYEGGGDLVHLSLGVRTEIRCLAIQWNLEGNGTATGFHLHFIDRGKVEIQHISPNDGPLAFQLINFPGKSVFAKLLDLAFVPSEGTLSMRPLAIAVVGRSSSPTLRGMQVILGRIWSALPERVKGMLRPIVRSLRNRRWS